MKCGIFDGITSIIPQSKGKYNGPKTIRDARGDAVNILSNRCCTDSLACVDVRVPINTEPRVWTKWFK
jgi:hypothetical protein